METVKAKSGKGGPILLLEKGKKSGVKLLFSRTGIIVVLLVAQILLLLSGLLWLERLQPYIWGGSLLLSIGVVIHLMNSDDNPAMKLTWSVLIMALPVFGVALYLFIKLEIGHRVMIRKYQDILCQTANLLDNTPGAIAASTLDGPVAGIAAYLESRHFPVYENTAVSYFPSGEKKFDELLVQLKNARSFIFLEYFIIEEGYMWGRVLELLSEKVKEGVEVRVLYDGTCAFSTLPYGYPEKLQKLGIQCKMFAPIRPFVSTHYNNRDHRKILVIDGKVAFTGGINLADRYINLVSVYGHWKDTAVMLRGDAVRSFTLMFIQLWNISGETDHRYEPYLSVHAPAEAEGLVIPYGDSPLDHDQVGEMVYMDMINRAERYVHIMTPYLILDNEMITALTFAAQRGVEVILLLPHIPDKKFAFALAHGHYPRLLKSGVRIYEYTPGFVHAKVFTCDGQKAVVGTINLDYRSLYHHFECGAYLYRVPEIARIEEDVQSTLAVSRPMTQADLKTDSLFMKIGGKLLKVVAPLM